MTTFTSICLLALLSLVAGSPTGQHSIEKRQTTVSKSKLAFPNYLFINPVPSKSGKSQNQNSSAFIIFNFSF